MTLETVSEDRWFIEIVGLVYIARSGGEGRKDKRGSVGVRGMGAKVSQTYQID